MIGAGMALELLGRGRVRLAGLGAALSGFGLFFLGIGILAAGFAEVADRMPMVESEGPLTIVLALGLGILLTLVTQSSSAAVVIALKAAASGGLALVPAAAVVIGTNIGTTSTAGFAAIGATTKAKRVVLAHVAFNALAEASLKAQRRLLPWAAAAGEARADPA
jgi:phosphate:Na+ symporter